MYDYFAKKYYITLQIWEDGFTGRLQMATASIEEKAKYLLENIPDRNPFFAFANMAETSDQERVDVYLAQISDKGCQSPSPRQRVICDFYFTYRPRAIILIHGFLSHLLGDGFVFANGYYKPLPHHPLSVF